MSPLLVSRSKLVKILARLYPSSQDIYRLCGIVDIRISHVTLTGKIINDWDSVYMEAVKVHALSDLVDHVKTEYPDDAELLSLLSIGET